MSRGADTSVMPRKIHSKSRFGCNQCKSRHVKCGEEKPSCLRCVKRRDVCSYEEELRSTSSPETSIGSRSPRSGDRAIGNHELYLMHWYSTEVYDSIAQSPEVLETWQKLVPREAVKHEFLLNALFAVSCLHHAYHDLSSYTTYIELALKYHDLSLNAFRLVLSEVSVADPNVALMSSGLFVIIALASSRTTADTPSETLLSARDLMCGCRTIVQTSREAVLNGMLRDLLITGDGIGAPTYHPKLYYAMNRLRARVAQISKFVPIERRLVYENAITYLETFFKEHYPGQPFSSIFAYLIQADEQLVELFRQNDPMSQLIWAHYGVLLLQLDGWWWGEGFGVQLIESLCEKLHTVDPEWMQWTEWPRECVSSLQAGKTKFGIYE